MNCVNFRQEKSEYKNEDETLSDKQVSETWRGGNFSEFIITKLGKDFWRGYSICQDNFGVLE